MNQGSVERVNSGATYRPGIVGTSPWVIRKYDSTEIEMVDINKAVSHSLKDIIINVLNKIRSMKKDLITKQFFPLLLPFSNKL